MPDESPHLDFHRALAESLAFNVPAYLEMYDGVKGGTMTADELRAGSDAAVGIAASLASYSRDIGVNRAYYAESVPRNQDPQVVQPLMQALSESWLLLSRVTDEDSLAETRPRLVSEEELREYMLDPAVLTWLEQYAPQKTPGES